MYATVKDLEMELWLRRRESGDITWVTQTGSCISIKDMSEQHLVNTIEMFKRQEQESEISAPIEIYY